MGSLVISNKVLDKYFGYLKDLDDRSKRNLIDKLTQTFKGKKEKFDVSLFFGKWEDNRNSDEIISDIRKSRVNKINTESFE